MLTDIDMGDDEGDLPELINDPVIKRYGTKIHELLWELIQETEHYELSRPQIDQLIESLRTLRAAMVFAEDLERLDAMLRLTFPDKYYSPEDDLLPLLTTCPLGSCN